MLVFNRGPPFGDSWMNYPSAVLPNRMGFCLMAVVVFLKRLGCSGMNMEQVGSTQVSQNGVWIPIEISSN